ncbi:MAG: CAP domain-containing protein, partial [Albidovulum sp.]
MTLNANEQYLLELLNRARLDPAGEAARYGIGLNDGLAPGTLTAAPMQVLAPDTQLELAAEGHSNWMLANNVFSHTGAGGSTPGARMSGAGYTFTGSWSWGENIAWSGTTGSLNLGAAIDAHHRGLFLSSGHRTNILNDFFSEVGLAQIAGSFTTNGTTYNASMLTQNFARSGAEVFVTGVAYSDSDNDDFYSIGEGQSNIRFSIAGSSANTSAAGG